MQNSGRSKPIQPGHEAPDFSLECLKGEPITLANSTNEKNLLLWFSRGFQCNFCRGHMQNFTEGYDLLQENNTHLVQIAPNLKTSAQRFFGEDYPRFPFICDPDKRLYAVYGLGDRGALSAPKNAIITFATAARTGELRKTAYGSWIDTVNRNFIRRLHHHALTAVEHGIFLINSGKIVQYHEVVGPIDPIPKVSDLLQVIQERCPT